MSEAEPTRRRVQPPMSAFIVDKTHIDLLIAAGLHGPRGLAVSPEWAWRKLSWFAVPYGDVRKAEPKTSYEEAVRELTSETADELGQLLVMENVASVAYRYSEAGRASYYGPEVAAGMEELALPSLPGPTEAYYLEPYRYSDPGYRLNAAEILQALDCFEYQSCEHDEWPRSETLQFCDALRHAVCSRLGEGPWEWDAGEVARARAALPSPASTTSGRSRRRSASARRSTGI